MKVSCPERIFVQVKAIDRDLNYSDTAQVKFGVVPDPRDLQIAALENELEERNRELDAELQDARAMQMSLMPKSPPRIKGIDVAGICEPATEVGGDYITDFWLDVEKTELAIVLIDVTGHRMRAAATTFFTNGMLQSESRNSRFPGAIMEQMHRSLQETLPRRAFVAMSFARLIPIAKR